MQYQVKFKTKNKKCETYITVVAERQKTEKIEYQDGPVSKNNQVYMYVHMYSNTL